jgi:uncharacterized membrane protein YkvI
VLDLWRRYLLPGFVFQGVTIGGGYATGRELVEFFGPPGPAGGLLGMLVAAMVFSAVLAVSFELVRLTRAFDYKSFFTLLLGRGWVLFEVAYVLLLLVILSVLGAAAGEIAHGALGLPRLAGTLALMAVIGLIVARGSGWVEKSTAAVALSLYAIYLALIAWTFTAFGDRVAAGLAAPVGGGWFGAGVTYAGYNLSCAAAVFFCVRHARSRRDALTAGALAGPITMLPGVLLFASLMAFHPEIGAAAVPSAYVLAQLQAPAFALVFQLVVFGALVSTGAPLLHAINERAAAAFAARGRAMPQALRPALSLSTMAVAIFAASAVGLVGLIARGYGWLTWAFIVLQVIPVLTIGIWKIRALGAAAPPPAAAGASAS